MRIEDRLDRDIRNKLNILRDTTPIKKKKTIKPKDENFSERYIEDLIGIYRPIYYRGKGAYRQR